MVVQYLGHSSFKLKGKEATVLIDPYDAQIGKKYPTQSEIDILLTSHGHDDHHNLEGVKGDYFLIDGPGEYDVKNVSVTGIPSFHDKKKGAERGINTIYVIEMEGITLCHLGDLGHVLSEDQVEAIGTVDVLFVPVGGKYTIDAADAVKVIGQIEPSVVIPMHYGNEKLGLDDIAVFLKEMGVEKQAIGTSTKFGKEDFSDESEGSKVLVME
jgi:L-ascorbate metabolism protein UlaG (beta-lactamase superfamily)